MIIRLFCLQEKANKSRKVQPIRVLSEHFGGAIPAYTTNCMNLHHLALLKAL
jgi:hypothetical protein